MGLLRREGPRYVSQRIACQFPHWQADPHTRKRGRARRVSEYTLTLHRGKFAISFREGSRRLRISTGTEERGLAEARARQIWDARHAAKSERIEDLWPEYVRDRIKEGARGDRFKAHWTALAPMFGKRVGTGITRDDCRDYVKQRKALGYAPSTIRTDLELLRACLRWRYGTYAPAIAIPPASPPRDQWLTKAEARSLVDAAKSPHVKLFLTLGLSTGARAAAILDLTWDRIDFAHGTIDYRPAGRHQTNKRRTVVPMNATARGMLEEAYAARLTDYVIEFQRKQVGSIKKSLERLGAATGIKVSPHVLRHTCAVWMAQEDVPMQKIAQYLGHTSTRVTEAVYARYSPSFMKDAGAAAEF